MCVGETLVTVSIRRNKRVDERQRCRRHHLIRPDLRVNRHAIDPQSRAQLPDLCWIYLSNSCIRQQPLRQRKSWFSHNIASCVARHREKCANASVLVFPGGSVRDTICTVIVACLIDDNLL